MRFWFLSFLLGLGQGVLHAAGPDHLAALITLSQNRRQALTTALRFALGHAVVLGTVAAFCLLLGLGLSETFESWAEITGGLLLVGLAVMALWFPQTLEHGHPPFNGHGPLLAHSHLPSATGALLALSGVRALLLAVPPLVVGGSASGWAFLPGFALGILVGMATVGLLWSKAVVMLPGPLFQRVNQAVAVGTGLLGLFWVWVRL